MKDLNKYFDVARKIARELWTGSREWEKHVEEEGVRDVLRERFDGRGLERGLNEFEAIDMQGAFEKINRKRNERRSRRVRRLGWSVAAAVMRGVVIGGWFFSPTTPVEPQVALMEENSKGVYLVVGDTGRIDLVNMLTFEDRGVTVSNLEEEELSYRENMDEVEVAVIHKLVVPKGCEYKLLLADGTRVWMNAESELSYPAAFSGESRVVSLKGQAYFEVAKSSVPFIVETERLDVRVLGTAFDVMSYGNEPTVQVTLEEGKVQISTEGKDRMLVPGEQAVFTREDSTLSVQKVRTEIFTGWRKGEFVFDDESFASVGRKLSRWYDFEIVVDEELQGKSLSGSLKRYESIEEFLNILQLTNEIDVEYQDHKVIIVSKEKLEL